MFYFYVINNLGSKRVVLEVRELDSGCHLGKKNPNPILP
jgi:hypothetical protein